VQGIHAINSAVPDAPPHAGCMNEVLVLFLTKFPSCAISLLSCSRGALSWGVFERSRMRRLRVGEDVSLTLGWPRVAVRAQYGALPLMRGWTWCGRRQGNLPDGFPAGKRPVPGRTVLRLAKRRGGAP